MKKNNNVLQQINEVQLEEDLFGKDKKPLYEKLLKKQGTPLCESESSRTCEQSNITSALGRLDEVQKSVRKERS